MSKKEFLHRSISCILILLLAVSSIQVIGNFRFAVSALKPINGKELFLEKQVKENNRKLKTQSHSFSKDIYTDIFWDLSNNATIDYNPVVLYINHFYWENLTIFSYEREYIITISANDTLLYQSNYEYSNYSLYRYFAYDWNISQYETNDFLNLTVLLYQYDNQALNHSATIGVYIGEIPPSPTIDLADFTIDLFHWPGSFISNGYLYNFYSLAPYYHCIIHSDGYCELVYGESNLYESNDLSASAAREVMTQLINWGFFQLKSVYYANSYDYYWLSYYQLYVQSRSVQEWRQAEECSDFVVKPEQYEKCLNLLKDTLTELSFAPKRFAWQMFLIIAGSSLGGLGVIITTVYLIFGFRRRRR
jgi:hypothetical protein